MCLNHQALTKYRILDLPSSTQPSQQFLSYLLLNKLGICTSFIHLCLSSAFSLSVYRSNLQYVHTSWSLGMLNFKKDFLFSELVVPFYTIFSNILEFYLALKIVLAVLGHLHLHINFIITLSMSTIKVCQYFDYDCIESLGIWKEQSISLHLYECFLCFFCILNLVIYLFMAVLGLRFWARAFSSCGKRGPLFIAVHGPLTIAASLVEHRLQTRRLSSCSSRAQLLRGMWNLPRPGLKPVSPALAGGFSTTAPPGKPCVSVL